MVTDRNTRAGIDSVNSAIRTVDHDDPFSQVQAILEGNASSRKQRGVGKPDICDVTLPGNNTPSTNDPGMVAVISPNSYDAGLNGASNPVVEAVGVTYQLLIQANPRRASLVIQNTGSTNLFIVWGSATQYGLAGAGSAVFHEKIASGQTLTDNQWIGRVDIVSDNPNGQVSCFERFKLQQSSS